MPASNNDPKLEFENIPMKRTCTFCLYPVLFLAMVVPFANGQEVPKPAPEPVAQESPEQRDIRMEWWREARFGMFVHWGLYSGLAGTWKGKMVGKRGGMEWLQNRVGAHTDEYLSLIHI